MTVRPGMQALIDYLRSYGQAATDDTFHGVTYWDDQQLQDILDRHGERVVVKLEPANRDRTVWRPVETSRQRMLEDDLLILTSDNTTIVTSHTYSLLTGEITFVSSLSAYSVLFVEAFQVQMYEALAELWDMKAAQRTDYVTFRAGNNRMDAQQEYEHCITQRDYYRNKIIRRFPKGKARWR